MMYDNNQMQARRNSLAKQMPGAGPPPRMRPRGPPPTSPYGMMHTPPSRHGAVMNTPTSQRGPPGSGPMPMDSSGMRGKRGPPPRGPIPKGPPPKGPMPNGPPPRTLPQGGTPGRSPNFSSRMDYPNSNARQRPGSANSRSQGELIFTSEFTKFEYAILRNMQYLNSSMSAYLIHFQVKSLLLLGAIGQITTKQELLNMFNFILGVQSVLDHLQQTKLYKTTNLLFQLIYHNLDHPQPMLSLSLLLSAETQ